jgi:hypothetical protein
MTNQMHFECTLQMRSLPFDFLHPVFTDIPNARVDDELHGLYRMRFGHDNDPHVIGFATAAGVAGLCDPILELLVS